MDYLFLNRKQVCCASSRSLVPNCSEKLPLPPQNIILHPFGRLDLEAEAVIIEPIPEGVEGYQAVAQRWVFPSTDIDSGSLVRFVFPTDTQTVAQRWVLSPTDADHGSAESLVSNWHTQWLSGDWWVLSPTDTNGGSAVSLVYNRRRQWLNRESCLQLEPIMAQQISILLQLFK